jgi:site-specific recombinase XerD
MTDQPEPEPVESDPAGLIDLVASPDAAAAAELAALEATARALAHDSRARSTWTAYDSDLRQFGAWCDEHGLDALPAVPLTVARYLADVQVELKPSTLRRRLAAISVAHQLAGHPTPTRDPAVRAVWSGIRRRHGVAPRKMRAARTQLIRAMLAPFEDRLADHRDRVLLLFGFAGALRRSELVGLDAADVREDEHGLRVRIGRSKTDQDAEGRQVGLPYGSHPATCPVRAWRAWLAASGITSGPAFRGIDRHGRLSARRLSTRAVADIVKRRAAAAGLAGPFAGHSMRAGFATEGYAAGTPELAIMRHGRWKSASVMRGYVEDGGVWTDNAAGRLGL